MGIVKSNLFSVWNRREAALGRRLTYREVSDRTGISTGTLYNYRRGNVERFEQRTLLALCTFFECQPGDLLILQANGDRLTKEDESCVGS
jgi:DNA-binding Xre family transcriptional regulator